MNKLDMSKYSIDLEGNIICTHKRTDFCPSCYYCRDCGEHSYGADPWLPKILGCKDGLHEITLAMHNNECVKCGLKMND